MSYYKFHSLIEKYSSSFTLKIPSEGSYEGGHYKVAYTEKELTGAIVSLSMRKVYQSGGYLTSQDRHLYTETPVECALSGALVVFEGIEYSIEEDSENGNERFTGVYSYVLRRKAP